MLGSAASMMGYYLVLFVLVIWMVIKIARSGSTLLALGTFFFWPLAIFPLIRNWGDRDTDIKIPFFASILTFGLILHMGNRVADKMVDEGWAMYLTDEDLAEIAEDNPEWAQRLREARDAQAAGGDYEDEIDWEALQDEVDLADLGAELQRRQSEAQRPPPVSQISLKVDDREAAPRRQVGEMGDATALEAEVGRLSFRFGSVAFASAHAELRLPRGFRWAPRFALGRIAELRGTPLEQASLGWVVHEKIDLAAPEAWYVDVLFVEAGHLPLPAAPQALEPVATNDPKAAAALDPWATLAGQPLSDGSGRTLGQGAYAPRWQADSAAVTWAVLDDPLSIDPTAELLAAKPTRHGALLFVVHGLGSDQYELGLRASRLMAAQTRLEPQWEHAHYQRGQDQRASLDLLAWVAGGKPGEAPVEEALATTAAEPTAADWQAVPGVVWISTADDEDTVIRPMFQALKDFIESEQLGEWDGESRGSGGADISFSVRDMKATVERLNTFVNKRWPGRRFQLSDQPGGGLG